VNPSSRGRLRSVTPPAPPSEIPGEILRYASLPPDRRDLLMHVHEQLEEIAYGNVVIVIQDGKVVQIETSEKIRLR
jgi:hypothetical protein